MRLRQLAADRAAAEHDQVLGPLGQIEDRLVGQMRRVREARHRRHRRRRAGRDDEAARAHALAGDLDLPRPDEPRRRPQHADAKTGKPLLGIVGCDRCDHAMDVRVDRREVDRGLVAVHAEAGRGAHRMRRLAGGDQGLRRDAAVVQAVAAHLALFDQHHARAHLDGAGGDRQPTGASADDAEIGRDRTRHRPLHRGSPELGLEHIASR